MLNAMMENENKIFTNISIFCVIIVAEHGVCDHDDQNIVKNFLVFTIVINMINFLAMVQVKTGKTMITRSNL